MEVIFGTTSDRKKNDLQNIINQLGFRTSSFKCR